MPLLAPRSSPAPRIPLFLCQSKTHLSVQLATLVHIYAMPTPESESFLRQKPKVAPTFEGVDFLDNDAVVDARDAIIREQWVQKMMRRLVGQEMGMCNLFSSSEAFFSQAKTVKCLEGSVALRKRSQHRPQTGQATRLGCSDTGLPCEIPANIAPLGKCYAREGVNHLEKCGKYRGMDDAQDILRPSIDTGAELPIN